MSNIKEKAEIISYFGDLNSTLIRILKPENIKVKSFGSRELFVENELMTINSELTYKLTEFKLYSQLSTELSNTYIIISDMVLELKNKRIDTYTKKAILNGSQYILSKLEFLKSEIDKKQKEIKPKYKSKYGDIKISEREFSYFILLAMKYGLISNVPNAEDQAFALTFLTNISEQNLREGLGKKYKNKPEDLLLKKKNLTILRDTLQDICDEIDILKDRLVI